MGVSLILQGFDNNKMDKKLIEPFLIYFYSADITRAIKNTKPHYILHVNAELEPDFTISHQSPHGSGNGTPNKQNIGESVPVSFTN